MGGWRDTPARLLQEPNVIYNKDEATLSSKNSQWQEHIAGEIREEKGNGEV